MKKFHQAFSIQFFVLFLILFVPVVSAQTFVVTETDDPTPDGCSSGTDCSLREAIIAANDVGSGTATIQLVGGQAYTLSIVNPSPENDFNSPDETKGSLKILNTDATVRIEATGSGMATIDANGIDRVFIIYDGTDVEIDEIEITGGDPENGQGGGIFVFNNIDLEITNSSITGNTASNSSGSGYGGGMWVEGVTMSITGSTISNNTAGFMGGGLRIIQYDEEVTVDSDVTIENSTISNNDGDDWSGGIHTENSDLTIIESTISQNQGSIGGGIRISSGNVTIDRSTIDGNIGSLGGGLDIDGGEVFIINSTISGNEAENFNGAGGIYAGNFSDAVIDIVNTTITNNISGTIGGVIRGVTGAQANAVINFTNSIVANQASGADCAGIITSKGYNLASDETCGFTETGDLQNSNPLLGSLQDNGGPVFTHAITGPLSPAVNNGSNALYASEGGGDPENDFDATGNARVYDFVSGGIIDIGSFELQQDATFEGCPVTNEDKIIFVKKGESGTGANWSDALGELRGALALFEDETCTTDDVEEIWVSAGTYLPTDDSGDREATFLMPGVDIYGGFEGGESNTNQRDLASNTSILSGEINDDGNLSGNSYHVVTSMDESSAFLHDFTITGGNANGSEPHDRGGGLYASNGGIKMADVLFENNFATTAGGGAYVVETVDRIGAQHPSFTRTTFRNNESGEDGGGLALEDAKSRITSVTFENNDAGQFGGGLFNDGADAVLKNVIFKENYADLEGGGILNTNSSPKLFNVLIINNDSKVNGGGIVNGPLSDPMLTNVTISGNDAELGNGGGMYNRNVATPMLLNTIVWGNTADNTGNEIWNSVNSSIELDYSIYGSGSEDIVEGDGFTATNSQTTNPLFENTGGGDFTLKGSSPAINTGDPDTEMSDFKLFGPDEIDLAENPRVFNGDVDIIDIGAYEFQGEPVAPSSCPATDGILFVKKGESGTGASWDDALGELRDALLLLDTPVSTGECSLEEVDEIWVAAGTYLPTADNSEREATFVIPDGVNLIGGFEGVSSESSTEDRDWETNMTILSGDIDEDDTLEGNSYHVTAAFGIVNETIFDGFYVTGGNANGGPTDFKTGGGLISIGSVLTIRNIVFQDNFAEISGGGVFIQDSGEQPVFTNVQFSNNESILGGGLGSEKSSPRISGSIFSDNTANWGGGARLLGGSPLIDQTIFTGNTGNTSGGGLSLKAGTVAKSVPTANAEPENQVIVTNSEFRANNVTDENGGGGGIQIDESNVIFRNILVSGNSSDGYGGGIEFIDAPLSLIINSTITGNQTQKLGGGIQITEESNPTIQNSIVWNNDSIEEGSERADNFSIGTGTPVISYSLIEGCNPGGTWDEFCGTDGGNNLTDGDPVFETGISTSDSPTTDGDFSLTSASPVINIGDNTLYTDSGGDIDNDLDLAEQSRLFDGTTDVIDLGAFEFQGEPDGEPVVLDAPTLSSPSNGASDIDLPVTLDWSAVDGATSYDVQVVEESGSFDTPDFEDETSNTDIEVTGLSESTEYKWRVRSKTSEEDSEWSEVWTFTTTVEEIDLDAPTLSGPADEATDVERPVTLAWNSVDGAEFYRIQLVEETGSFDTPDFDDTTSDTDIVVTGLNPTSEYKWRVRAEGSGDPSEWSEVWTFTTSAEEEELVAPQLSSPSDEATDVNLTVMLDWDAASGAESYQVQLVEETGSFDTPDFDDETTDTDIEVPGLDPLTEYKWRVRSLTSEDESEWSDVWTFTTTGLPEGEDQRIFVSNASDHEFSKSDFGISNNDYSIIIESLPDEGDLKYDGDPVSAGDEVSITDINSGMLTWSSPEEEYGYNFTSFEFTIVDENENQSDTSYTLTIDLGDQSVELMSGGWRFMTNPSNGDSYNDLFSGITVEIGPPPSQTLYELDQKNYEWDPVESTGDEPGVGTPFIIYVLEDDIPNLPLAVQSGDNWNDLDGSYSYSGLEYDGDGTSPNPGNFFLLGNPHPIGLDFCQFTEENIATSVYFWDPEASGGNGDYINLNCAALDEVLIAPFQSFWIRTTDANPDLEIPMEAYIKSTTDGYFKEKTGQEEPFLITMHIAGEDGLFTNRAQILFSDEATEGLDRFDAPKLSAEGLASQWLSFYSLSQDGMKYAFQSLPTTKLNEEKVRIPMDIQTTESGRFTLDWSLPESQMFSGSYFIRDNNSGEVIELQDGASYSFEITPDQSMKVSGDERSAKSLGDFADLENSDPRFELLIAASGIDGLTELGAIPDNFTLAQNYPNPFNPTTVISYQLPVNSEVRLEVYDLLGRNVATLVNGQVSAGRHTVNFDATNLSSGVYLYRLQAGAQIMTRKLTILK